MHPTYASHPSLSLPSLSLPSTSPSPSLFPPYPISLSSPSPPPFSPSLSPPHHRVSLSVRVVSTSASTGVPFPTDSKRVFPNSTSSSTCFSSALSLAFSSWGERRERGRKRGERRERGEGGRERREGGRRRGERRERGEGEKERRERGRRRGERQHSIQLHVHVHVIYGVVGFLSSLFTLCYFFLSFYI